MKKKVLIIIMILVVAIFVYQAYDTYTYKQLTKLERDIGIIEEISEKLNDSWSISIKSTPEDTIPSYILSITEGNNIQIRRSNKTRIKLLDLKVGDTIEFFYKKPKLSEEPLSRVEGLVPLIENVKLIQLVK